MKIIPIGHNKKGQFSDKNEILEKDSTLVFYEMLKQLDKLIETGTESGHQTAESQDTEGPKKDFPSL